MLGYGDSALLNNARGNESYVQANSGNGANQHYSLLLSRFQSCLAMTNDTFPIDQAIIQRKLATVILSGWHFTPHLLGNFLDAMPNKLNRQKTMRLLVHNGYDVTFVFITNERNQLRLSCYVDGAVPGNSFTYCFSQLTID